MTMEDMKDSIDLDPLFEARKLNSFMNNNSNTTNSNTGNVNTEKGPPQIPPFDFQNIALDVKDKGKGDFALTLLRDYSANIAELMNNQNPTYYSTIEKIDKFIFLEAKVES